MDPQPYIDAIRSKLLTLGRFESAPSAALDASPGSGLSAAVWMLSLLPVARASGLDVTSASLVLAVRLYSSALSSPPDEIDPELTSAAGEVVGAFTANFTLGLPGFVDLLGAYGEALACRSGYLVVSDRLYRVVTITLPLIIPDAWDQEA